MYSQASWGGIGLAGLFALFWCGITFTFDALIVRDAARQLLAFSYAETAGMVESTAIDVDSDGEGTSYKPRVRFVYQADGNSYKGEHYRHGGFALGRKHAQAVIKRYPKGAAVRVFYRPSYPADAVLERGLSSSELFAALFLAPFNAVAVGLLTFIGAGVLSNYTGNPPFGVQASVLSSGEKQVRFLSFSPFLAAIAAVGVCGFLGTFLTLLLQWLNVPLGWTVCVLWVIALGAAAYAYRAARLGAVWLIVDPLRDRVRLVTASGTPPERAGPIGLLRFHVHERLARDSDGDEQRTFILSAAWENDPGDALELFQARSRDEILAVVKWVRRKLGLPAEAPEFRTQTSPTPNN